MKSIKELRQICQSTRPTIWSDFQNKFYYKVSIYFSYILIYLGLSANKVTLISGITSIVGGILIISDNKLITLVWVFVFSFICDFRYV